MDQRDRRRLVIAPGDNARIERNTRLVVCPEPTAVVA
jgi:hypothetical protein